MNFKSKAGYQKWLAFGHMNGSFAKTPGNQPVKIKGKKHTVNHGNGSTQKTTVSQGSRAVRQVTNKKGIKPNKNIKNTPSTSMSDLKNM